MKGFVTRTLLSATGVLLLSGNTWAHDVQFSDLEQRIASLEAQVASQQGVQAAGYYSGEYGSVGDGCGCESQCGCNPCCNSCGCDSCRINSVAPVCSNCYADIQFMWLRPQVSEDWVGKLSESSDFSPRFIFGYESANGLGLRARYWFFDDNVNVLAAGTLGMELDVVDLEVTNRFAFRRTDVWLSGGIRYAGWALTDDSNATVTMDSLALTVAADLRPLAFSHGCSRWSFVYGARLSLLGGNWKGDNDIIDTIFNPEVANDNMLVHELYAGVEYGYTVRGFDLFARATYEMQNWQSDVLSEPGIGNGLAPNSIGSTDSISFIGPGLHFGVRY